MSAVMRIWKWYKTLREHDDDNVHYFPPKDPMEHVKSESCPCGPESVFDNRYRTREIKHRDCREMPQ